MRSSIPRLPGPPPPDDDPELPQIDHGSSEDERYHTGSGLPNSTFQFIGETGLSRPTGAALKLVRSQARKRVVSRLRKSQPMQIHALLRPQKEADKRSGEGDSEVKSQLGRFVTKYDNASPHSSPSSNGIDPFNTLRIDDDGKSQYLISQYYSIFYPTECAYSPIRPHMGKGEALQYSLSDPALLHASLAHVAYSLNDLGNIDMSSSIKYHVSKAVAMVNKRIANSRHKAVSMDTIGAVTTFTAFELKAGSVTSFKTHLDGLEALVKSVGGLQALLVSPFTLKYASWVDIVGAIVLGAKPRFERLNPARLPLHPGLEFLEPCSLLATRYKERLSSLTGLPGLNHEMIEVYRLLKHLIAKKERIAAAQSIDIPEAEFQALQSYCTQLMYRLIALIQYEVPDLLNPNALIFKLFGNAAVAHILMFTYNLPPRSGTHVLMSTRIRATLEMMDVRAFQKECSEMVLWIIMIGGLASIGSDDQRWFIQLLAHSCFAAGISRADELATSLTEFLWTDFYLGPLLDEFWNDLSVAQTVMEAGDEVGLESL
ncbi:hypothetical protein N431DRAFT_477794 [Stipitochalara longipes BDJ]|nr:hypothetical protein N431DRAFT_477794 [Stipitochalara longipes BDJ]